MTTTNLRDKIGQLFILGFRGSEISEKSPVTRDIQEENLGGIILFDRHLASKSPKNNIIDREQTRELISALQLTAKTSGRPSLLIAVDQEGGKVCRFKKEQGFTETPQAVLLGKESDFTATRQAASQTAALLKELGINFNLAPVADLNTNSENPIIGRLGRSFGREANMVIPHCRAWIDEHKKRNIISCLKHFPGHGSSLTDSHLAFVDISETWHRKELTPFQVLINEGLADTIMLGHLFLRSLDEKWPASLSPKAGALLRETLNFQGPIVTDDMQMKAITKRYGLAKACCQSLKAGTDLIIIGNNLEYDADILKKIKDAVLLEIEEKKLSETRINEAWQRVTTLKKTLLQGDKDA